MDLEKYKFTEAHEWVLEEDGTLVVGISDFAQEQLNDIIFVELPETGTEVTAGQEVATVESTKTASGIHAPVTGTIEEVNSDLESSPELINQSPYEDGWLFKIVPDSEEDIESFISYEEYQKLCEES